MTINIAAQQEYAVTSYSRVVARIMALFSPLQTNLYNTEEEKHQHHDNVLLLQEKSGIYTMPLLKLQKLYGFTGFPRITLSCQWCLP